MRILAVLTMLVTFWAPAAAQQAETMTPEIMTTVGGDDVESNDSTDFFLSDKFTGKSTVLSADDVDALHRMQDPGRWLISTRTAGSPDLVSAIVPFAPDDEVVSGDLILFDDYDDGGAGTFRLLFCGTSGGTSIGTGRGSYNIDKVYMDGDDLIVGFDAATDVTDGFGTTTYEKQDLARFMRPDTGIDCDDWEHVGQEFDATGKISDTAHVRGAAVVPLAGGGSGIIFAFWESTCTLPDPSPTCSTPWQAHELVRWDGAAFSMAEDLTSDNWPEDNPLAALTVAPPTCAVFGGVDPNTAPNEVDVCAATWRTADDVLHHRFEWLPSTGVDSYNVYRGDLGGTSLSSHTCLTPTLFTDIQYVAEDTPASGTGYYYLVAEVIGGVEKTKGKSSTMVERTIDAGDACP